MKPIMQTAALAFMLALVATVAIGVAALLNEALAYESYLDRVPSFISGDSGSPDPGKAWTYETRRTLRCLGGGEDCAESSLVLHIARRTTGTGTLQYECLEGPDGKRVTFHSERHGERGALSFFTDQGWASVYKVWWKRGAVLLGRGAQVAVHSGAYVLHVALERQFVGLVVDEIIADNDGDQDGEGLFPLLVSASDENNDQALVIVPGGAHQPEGAAYPTLSGIEGLQAAYRACLELD